MTALLRNINFVLLTIAALIYPAMADAQVSWVHTSDTLYESQIAFLEIHPDDSNTLFAGVPGRLYRSQDAGETWKSVLDLKSPSSLVNIIRIDRFNPQRILVGSDEGVHASRNGGRTWKRIFYRPDEAEEKVMALASSGADSRTILAGTASGLFVTRDGGDQWVSLPPFRGNPIYQIDQAKKHSEIFMVAASDGLYVSMSNLSVWERIYHPRSAHTTGVVVPDGVESETVGNEQFGLEEVSYGASPISFVAVPNGAAPRITVFEDKDIFTTDDMGRAWRNESVNAFPDDVSRRPLVLAHDHSKMFVPTGAGIFVYDQAKGEVSDISWGLPSKRVSSLVYDATGDVLFAGTERGVFKLPHPEITIYLEERASEGDQQFERVMTYFDHEPTIRELQEVAMRYAEVHPEKIAAWRKAASGSAWLPKVSLGYEQTSDEVVELDRGGTKDPDRFIIGPDESDTDWSVDLSWDLSELMWNPDQTSIDNRSKLMVQLRDDILNELTHLYFARRRMQVESILHPPSDFSKLAERELQIQEYTAGIDAITGGYLSRALGPSLGFSSAHERVSSPYAYPQDAVEATQGLPVTTIRQDNQAAGPDEKHITEL